MNIWTKLFILALNNLKYGKLKLSINTDHHLISGKLPGPNADLIIENKDIIKKILIEGSVAFGEEYVNGNIKTSNLENLLSYFAVNNDEVEKLIENENLGEIVNHSVNHGEFNKTSAHSKNGSLILNFDSNKNKEKLLEKFDSNNSLHFSKSFQINPNKNIRNNIIIK